MGAISQDYNLLFAVFAAQLNKVTPSQIMQAAGAWAVDRTQDLPDRLVAAGALSAKDCRMLLAFVEEAVQANDGDAAATLVNFGGAEQVQRALPHSIVLTQSGHVSLNTRPLETGKDGELSYVPGVQESPGRYTGASEHARGGMGRVLLVHDEHLGREVALKELLP